MQPTDGIIELRDTQVLAYILETTELFFQTGYKVLQNQEKNGFIRCAKVIHNGKDKLVYDISKYKALESILIELSPEIFMNILDNLVDVVIEVKNNGFMQCENIDLSFDKVFVDTNNYKVYLIYLPINTSTSLDSYTLFEKELKKNILAAVDAHSNLVNPEVLALCTVLRDPVKSIDDIKQLFKNNDLLLSIVNAQNARNYEKAMLEQSRTEALYEAKKQEKKGFFSKLFKSDKKETIKKSYMQTQASEEAQNGNICLAAVGSNLEYEITKMEYVFGKKRDAVDGFLSFNSAISRIHCKIVYANGCYYIVDLGSVNGTYVNGARIPANQLVAIRVGDKVRLADSEFEIRYKQISSI